MDVNDKIQPVMNQRGYYVAVHTEGGEVPSDLADQCWTSERDARIGLSKFFSNYVETPVINKKEDKVEEV